LLIFNPPFGVSSERELVLRLANLLWRLRRATTVSYVIIKRAEPLLRIADLVMTLL
jgi:hypothetical protein